MWHPNNPDAPKPAGRVLVRTKEDLRTVGEWAADWTTIPCWVLDGGLRLDKHVTHWTEIPPFEEPQE